MATSRFDDLIVKAATDLDVPVDLALAVHHKGERYNPDNPESPKGAYGPMQVMPGTFAEQAKKLGIENPDIKNDAHNVYAGVGYLKEQLNQFQNPILALAAYNSGPGSVRKYNGVPPYAETQKYVSDVMGSLGVNKPVEPLIPRFKERNIVLLPKPSVPSDPYGVDPGVKEADPFIPWEAVESHEQFKAMDPEKQLEVKEKWFEKYIAPTDQFKALDEQAKQIINTNFLSGTRLPTAEQQQLSNPVIDPVDIAATALTGGAYGIAKTPVQGALNAAGEMVYPSIAKEGAKKALEWGAATVLGESGSQIGGGIGKSVGGDYGEIIGSVLGGTMPLVGVAKWASLLGVEPRKIKSGDEKTTFETETAKLKRILETPESEQPGSAKGQPSEPGTEPTWDELVGKYRKQGRSEEEAAYEFFRNEGGMPNAARKYQSARDWLREQQVKAAERTRAQQDGSTANTYQPNNSNAADFEAQKAAHEETLNRMREAANAGGFSQARPAPEAPVQEAGLPAVRPNEVVPAERTPTQEILARIAESGASNQNLSVDTIRALPIPKEIKDAILLGRSYGGVGAMPIPMESGANAGLPVVSQGKPNALPTQEASVRQATQGETRKAKEPWEMSLSEYSKAEKENIESGLRHDLEVALPGQREGRFGEKDRTKVPRNEQIDRVTSERQFELDNLDETVKKFHRKEISLAVSQGKTIPPEVLAEYPDLKQQQPPSSIAKQAIVNAVKAQPKTDLSLKEQKSGVIANIDKAIGEAPFDTPQTKDEVIKGETIQVHKDFVDVHIPGDGTFKVGNDKQTLKSVKAVIMSKFPTSVPQGLEPVKAANPSFPGRVHGRIAGDVDYFNEYEPKKVKTDAVLGKKDIRITEDGFATDNGMAIKDDAFKKTLPKNTEIVPTSAEKLFTDKNLIEAKINGVLHRGGDKFSPVVDVENENGVSVSIQAKYADAVHSLYPKATPYIQDEHHPVVFKDPKGNTVAIVLPVKGNAEYSEFRDKMLGKEKKSQSILRSESGAVSGQLVKDIADFAKAVNPFASKSEFWKPLSTVEQSNALLARRGKTFGDIDRVGTFVKKLHDDLMKWPEQTRKDAFGFMAGYAAPMHPGFDPELAGRISMLPDVDQKKLNQLVRLNRMLGQMAVKRGLIKEETFKKNEGQWIHYMYLRHILPEGSKLINPSTGKLDLNYAKKRNPDLTNEHRRALGWIQDVSVAVPAGASKILTDVAKFDYFKDISSNSKWAWQPTRVKFEGKIWAVGNLREELDAMKVVADHFGSKVPQEVADRIAKLERAISLTRPPPDIENWREIKGGKWGPLNGVWVKKPIYRDLVPIVTTFTDPTQFGRLVNAMVAVNDGVMSAFKVGKTALNPPTAVRNMVSNPVQLWMGGTSPVELFGSLLPQAIKSIRAKDPLFSLAKRQGIFKTNFSEAELGEIVNALKATMGEESPLTKIAVFSKGVADYYGKIDDLYKFAKFIEGRQKGLSAGDSAVEAQKWVMDYSLAHSSVKYLRRSILPFASYAYKITPLIAESLKKRPWIIAGLAAIPWLMTQYVKQHNKMTDKQWKAYENNLPSYVRDSKTLMPLPAKSPEGNIQWLDMGFFMPWNTQQQALEAAAGGDIPQVIRSVGVGNPMLSFLEMAMSVKGNGPPRDPFMQTDIYNQLDAPGVKAAKMMEWMYQLVGPSSMSSRGSLGKTLTIGQKDKMGRTMTPLQAGASWLGANIYAPTEQQGMIERYAKQKDLEASMYRWVKDHPNATSKETEDTWKRLMKKSEAIINPK